MARGAGPGVMRRPYGLLAGYFALAFLQLLATILRPPLPATNVRWQTVLLLVTAGLLIASLVLGSLLRDDRPVLALVLAGMVLVALATAGAAGGQGQLMAGCYLTLLGLIAALSMEYRALVVVVVLGATMYLVALVLQPRLDSEFYGFGVAALFAVVALVIGRLVGQLRDRATHDPLTGALNRNGLDAGAGLARDRDMRAGLETTVVEIDLDGFKQFNDEHGHLAGDDRLVGLTGSWRPILRHTDLLARTGGDEFVLILPATDRAEAEVLVTRMREANAAPWSYGAVTWESGESLPQALDRADAAMYAHKPRARGTQETGTPT